ncbi:MAG TPA: four helix bundle protein [Rhodothermales bacterium]|nr:four helix bundle protein [Rhodothermales bacterium]
MAFKFEGLSVWQLAIAYTDAAYSVAEQLPPNERFGLRDQLTRAANSIALNIAEGSTGQSDDEQNRFLGYALRSLVETVACLHLIRRRGYLADPSPLRETYREAEQLFAKLHAFRRTLRAGKPSGVREDDAPYNPDTPF